MVVFDDQNVGRGGEHLGQGCGPLLVPCRAGGSLRPRGEQYRRAAAGERTCSAAGVTPPSSSAIGTALRSSADSRSSTGG